MKLVLARRLSLATYLGLILFVMLWIVFLGDVAREHISVLLLLCVPPLLLPLRGVLAGREKPLIWGALISLAYALHGGVVLFAPSADRWFGLLELVLSLGYLISASLFIRWRAQAAAQLPDPARDHTHTPT